jgi:hypothetical protein
MQELVYEDLLNRIFLYIRLTGASFTRNSTVTALKLIEELLITESTGSFDRVMAEVQGRLNLSEISLPLICPQVNRSSIGYQDE